MLLVYEPAAGGHHLVYLQYILEGALARGVDVRLVTSDALKASPHFAERLGAFDVPMDTVMASPPAPGLKGLRRHVQALRRVVGERPPSDVLIPYLDGLLYALPLLPRGPRYHGILFSPTPFTHPRKRHLARLALSLRRVAALHHLDADLVRGVDHRRLHWLADPVPANPPEPDARERLGLGRSRRVVLIAGVLTRRKGIAELLRAASEPMWPGDVDLMLVGRPDDEVRALLDRPQPAHVVLRDEHVSDGDFARWFQAADVVAATYPTYLGSSGIVLNAAAAGTPLLVLGQGWIGRAVQDNRLGVAVPDLGPASVLSGLDEALGMAADPMWEPAPSFVAAHSVSAFQEQLFRYLI